MKKQEIQENGLFWLYRLLRTLMFTGVIITAFVGCVWAFQLDTARLLNVYMAVMAFVVPLWAGIAFAGRVRGKGRFRAACAGTLLALVSLLAAYRFGEDTGAFQLCAFIAAATLADVLFIGMDDQVESALLPEKHFAAGVRARGFSASFAGIAAPVLAVLLLSRTSHRMALYQGTVLLQISALGTLVLGVKMPRTAAEPKKAEKVENREGPEAFRLISWSILNLCMGATVGAILLPMLLSRGTIGGMAAVIACFTIGFTLRQRINFWFWRWEERRGFSTVVALLLLVCMAFGMARTGWQRNVCAVFFGIFMAAIFTRMEDSGAFLRNRTYLLQAICWLIGSLAGLMNGMVMEKVLESSRLISAICARFTGMGEGSGMAMTIVAVGFIGAISVHVLNRLTQKQD